MKRVFDPNSPRAFMWAALLVPLLVGLVSVALGADANFDLRNYHLYNPYAFLHGRLNLDLAPAGMQNYFNPLLDLPYYYMSLHWPPRLTGFVMGWVQGLDFVLLLGIVRHAVPVLPATDRYRLPLYLAVAGCLGANFLTAIGNSMGDATSALFPLAALLLILARWDVLLVWSRRAALLLLLAGLLAGMGVGLKLTTAVYALALCLAFVAAPLSWPARFRLGFLFGLGVLLGLAFTGGFWFLKMWQDYGDPLYPQFSALFPSPLIRATNVADKGFLPKSLLQALLWPFLITLDSRRVGELRVLQVIWALLYALLLAWAAQSVYRRLRHRESPRLEPRHAFLLVYIVLSFILWMKLFSVYRYVLAIELLAPLAVFILLVQMLGQERGRRAAAWLLGGTVCIALLGSTRSWGHEPWGPAMMRVDAPAFANPATTTVLTVGEADSGPYTWLTVFFPPETAFAGLHTSLLASRAYVERVHAMARERGGAVYAIVAAYENPAMDEVQRRDMDAAIVRVNAWAARFGFDQSSSGCPMLHWLNEKLNIGARVQQTAASGQDSRCELLSPEEGAAEIAAQNQASLAEYAQTLALYGFSLDAGSCTEYSGYIGTGTGAYPYRLCRVTDTGMPAKLSSQAR